MDFMDSHVQRVYLWYYLLDSPCELDEVIKDYHAKGTPVTEAAWRLDIPGFSYDKKMAAEIREWDERVRKIWNSDADNETKLKTEVEYLQFWCRRYEFYYREKSQELLHRIWEENERIFKERGIKRPPP